MATLLREDRRLDGELVEPTVERLASSRAAGMCRAGTCRARRERREEATRRRRGRGEKPWAAAGSAHRSSIAVLTRSTCARCARCAAETGTPPGSARPAANMKPLDAPKVRAAARTTGALPHATRPGATYEIARRALSRGSSPGGGGGGGGGGAQTKKAAVSSRMSRNQRTSTSGSRHTTRACSR